MRATRVLLIGALFVWAWSTALAVQDGPPPEHPVVQPMRGAIASPDSSVDDFGRLTVNYRGASGPARDVAEGRYWHLFYQLDNRDTSRDEILSNYETEAQRLGGEILNRRATRLVFRLTRPGGGVICVGSTHARVAPTSWRSSTRPGSTSASSSMPTPCSRR